MNTRHTPTQRDVVAVLVRLASYAGRVTEQYNTPRSTSVIRSRLRGASTAEVRQSLRNAERVGDVVCVSVPSNWRHNAAQRIELHWRLSDAALAKAGAA